MTRELRKLFISLFIGLLIISVGSQFFYAIEATEIVNEEDIYISADEFFLRLELGLEIDLNNVYDYGYCSKQIGYMIDKGFIDNYNAHLLTIGEFSTTSLIDKGLKVCGYFDRPLDIEGYIDNTKQVAIDIGLIPENSDLDFTKKLTYKDAEVILEKLINNDFKRVKYEDETCLISYKLYEFANMYKSYNRTKEIIEYLPIVCIEELNKQGYTLNIVDSVLDYYPNKNKKYISAFITFDNKQIFIRDGFEEDLLHEVGHLMLRKLKNKQSVCNYLFKIEGNKASDFPYIRSEYGAEELICDSVEFLLMYKDNENMINKFKENCPKIYFTITEVLFNTSGNRNKCSVTVSELERIGK